jgi:hypothetical protein
MPVLSTCRPFFQIVDVIENPPANLQIRTAISGEPLLVEHALADTKVRGSVAD